MEVNEDLKDFSVLTPLLIFDECISFCVLNFRRFKNASKYDDRNVVITHACFRMTISASILLLIAVVEYNMFDFNFIVKLKSEKS